MKKSLLLLLPLFLLMVVEGHARSANADLFVIDEDEISSQISELTKLEDYVTSHQGLTLTDVINSSNQENLNLDMNMLNSFATAYQEEPPAGIPSFLWGCILGPAGIAIVYFTTEDNQETRKALYGCLAQGAVWVLYVAASYVFAFSAFY